MDNPKFGRVTKTKILGNVKTEVEENYVDGVVNPPTRRRIEERIRVSNQKEELERYLEFSDFIHANKGVIDPAFKIDFGGASRWKSRDHYDVIKSWTSLTYEP